MTIVKAETSKVYTVDVTKALAIDGWMTMQELTWLARQAVEHRYIAEVGSYLGRSTRALLDHCSGIVYAFDDWKGPREIYLSKEERDKLFPRFCSNIQDHINAGKVSIHIGDLGDIDFNQTVDMVFIDGSHEYEDVKRDILFWKTKLTPGGLLCGHDANWTTVGKAVAETLGLENISLAKGTTIWYTEV